MELSFEWGSTRISIRSPGLGSNANTFVFENVAFALKCNVVSCSAFALKSNHLRLNYLKKMDLNAIIYRCICIISNICMR